MDWERQIPPFAKDALEMLHEAIEESGNEDESLSKDDARSVLVADDRFADGDAEYTLDVLQSRGHIYYVDERVYITPTDKCSIEMSGSACITDDLTFPFGWKALIIA